MTDELDLIVLGAGSAARDGANGSRTAVPPIEGLDEVGWIDHISALELTELPESLLVVGGGPFGLELAQIFHRFGSRITLVQGAERISPRSGAEAALELSAALEDEGLDIRPGSTVSRLWREGESVVRALPSR
jgi:pyruvate/2-oxoglutarate dehydrogenase complex dihydrolipoamide dehydrogenase (E3) component